MGKVTETESGMVVSRGQRKGNGELVRNGDRISVWIVHFVLCIFDHNFFLKSRFGFCRLLPEGRTAQR